MTIYEYFKDYKIKYFKMKDKLIELKEAQRDFYSLTGTKFTDIPKSGTSFGFDEQLIKIEKIKNDYLNKEHECAIARKKCVEDLDKIENPKYRTILTLAFLEQKNNKSISIILDKTYKLDYSIDYVKQLKNKAIKCFERLIIDY